MDIRGAKFKRRLVHINKTSGVPACPCAVVATRICMLSFHVVFGTGAGRRAVFESMCGDICCLVKSVFKCPLLRPVVVLKQFTSRARRLGHNDHTTDSRLNVL